MIEKLPKTLKVKKSVFLPFIEHIENIDEIKLIVKKYRELYKNASHICWGYILTKDLFGCSDNGEPYGTAGLQILNVLKYHQVSNSIAIVVRYFGGIKLGRQLLSESYKKAIENVFE